VTLKRAGVVLGLIAAIVIVTLWPNRVYHDFWPPDASGVGPNIVASVVVWLVVGLTWLRPHLKRLHQSHQAMHDKVDHVIKHSTDIPDMP
jgi:hypothetical protein